MSHDFLISSIGFAHNGFGWHWRRTGSRAGSGSRAASRSGAGSGPRTASSATFGGRGGQCCGCASSIFLFFILRVFDELEGEPAHRAPVFLPHFTPAYSVIGFSTAGIRFVRAGSVVFGTTGRLFLQFVSRICVSPRTSTSQNQRRNLRNKLRSRNLKNQLRYRWNL